MHLEQGAEDRSWSRAFPVPKAETALKVWPELPAAVGNRPAVDKRQKEINACTRYDVVYCSRASTVVFVLYLGASVEWSASDPGHCTPGTHWAGQRASVDVLGQRKASCYCGESNPYRRRVPYGSVCNFGRLVLRLMNRGSKAVFWSAVCDTVAQHVIQ